MPTPPPTPEDAAAFHRLLSADHQAPDLALLLRVLHRLRDQVPDRAGCALPSPEVPAAGRFGPG
ncbi:hypothetical protein ACFC1T_20125 [Kitasatospora sp. NPDC056076]|uniref:hypothetical protein n=1 Tax=Kitasatospora sp. NPDC056076 TaxID=3345703 RepID=UPI0035D6B054